jgi:formate dehydrogenase subunit delta
MNAEHLVKMANQIGDFFDGEPDKELAAKEVVSHLTRFWAPTMRQQLVEYSKAHNGEGLRPLVKTAVEIVAKNMNSKAA